MCEKIKVVQDAPSPKNVSKLNYSLGLLSYYSKFLPNLSTILVPLYRLLYCSTLLKWSQMEEEVLKSSKQLLTSVPELIHFDSGL